MLIISYGQAAEELVEVNDPILDRVSTRWEQHVGQRYAGYLIVLFGAGDAEVASWFARAVVQLDSATGRDVACMVFAKELKVRAVRRSRVRSVVTTFGPPPDVASPSANDFDVDVLRRTGEIVMARSMVDRDGHASRLVDRSGRSLWEGDERDITATTYAADGIARELGILDKLPCIVAIDAMPDGTLAEVHAALDIMHVLPFASIGRSDILPTLRRTVQALRNQEAFGGFHSRVARLDELAVEARSLNSRHAHAERALLNAECKERSLEGAITRGNRVIDKAASELRIGSLRRFRAAMEACPILPSSAVAQSIAQVSGDMAVLRQLVRTVWSLNIYLERRTWPLSAADLDKVGGIVAKWAAALDPGTVEHDWRTRAGLGAIVDLLDAGPGRILEPVVAELKQAVSSAASAKRAALTDEMRRLDADLKEAAAALAPHDVEKAGICDVPAPSIAAALRQETDRTTEGSPQRSDGTSEIRFDVFVSYSSDDRPEVLDVVARMRAGGLRCWLDQERIPFGESVTKAIEEGLRSSRFVVVCLSPSFARSQWCRGEYASILNGELSGKTSARVIPLTLRACADGEIPLLLRDKKRVSIADPDGFARLVDYLQPRHK